MKTSQSFREARLQAISRFDKACGKSFIAENQKCSKSIVSRSAAAKPAVNSDRQKQLNLLSKTGIAVAGVVLLTLGKTYQEIKVSGLPDSAKTPEKPPEGYYDSLKIGDILYRTFPDDVFGVTRAHYAIYVGKNEKGQHGILHATTKFDEKGKEIGSHVIAQSIDDYNPKTSFKKAQRSDPSRPQPTTEQLHRIVGQLINKDVTWNGFTENCESFARAVTNDIPTATQSKKMNPVSRQIVRGLLNLMYEGMEGPGKLTNKQMQDIVTKEMKDSMITPKERAELILRPLVRKPVKVISLSLSPEEKPIGVFKAAAPNGQQHYYSFKLGNTVEFGRIVQDKTDAEDECECDKCKGKSMNSKTSTSKQLLDCQERAYELMQRIDKKCGASGIPETATCSKSTGNTQTSTVSARKKKGKIPKEALLALGAFTATALAGGLVSSLGKTPKKKSEENPGTDRDQKAKEYKELVEKVKRIKATQGAAAASKYLIQLRESEMR